MFGAIGRYFRAFLYLITGRVDSARKALSANPYVIQATFDSVIQEKRRRLQQYKNAVATMIAQQEKKIHTVKQLTEDVTRLERMKEGAAAKAKDMVARLKGKETSMEKIKKNQDYMKCLSAFKDFTSTLQEKQDHIVELEEDSSVLGENIGNHKIQLTELLRDIEKLKEESASTVADIITAKEEESIANLISGISEDRSSKELEDMRDLRQQAKAKARISREMAGTDTKRQEAEFLEYSRTNVASDEFDQLIGLADEADTSPPEQEEKQKTQLPEE